MALRMTGPMGLVVTSRSRLRRMVLARNSPPVTNCSVMWVTASLQALPPTAIRMRSVPPWARLGGWLMMLPRRPRANLPGTRIHLPGQPAQAAPQHELEGRAHHREAEPSRPPEGQLQVLHPHQPRTARSGPGLEDAGAAHDPAEVGALDPARRSPAGDLHRIMEPHAADPGEGVEALADAVAARLDGHGREHHPARLALPIGERRPRHLDRGGHRHPLLHPRPHPVLLAQRCRMMVPCNGPSDGGPSTSPERPRSWRSSTAPRTPSTTAARTSRSTPPWRPPTGRSPRERTGWTWAASKQAPAPRSTRPRSWSACCRWSRRCDLGPTR